MQTAHADASHHQGPVSLIAEVAKQGPSLSIKSNRNNHLFDGSSTQQRKIGDMTQLAAILSLWFPHAVERSFQDLQIIRTQRNTTMEPTPRRARGSATPTQPVTPTQPMTPNQNMVAPSGKDVLLAPDQSYYPVNPINNGVSPFPLYQAPKGDPVEVRVEVKDDKVKDRNTLIGVGVGAAAMLVTGGLALPIIAGTVMYNVLKKDGYAKYSAYKNTYVYELRAAIAKDLNVRPEFLLMSRKGVSFDDNEMLQRYMARPNRVTIQVAVLNVPAVGSNYHLANGMPYPPVQSVSLVKPGKK